MAARLRLNVFVVSNGSRPIRPPGMSNVSMVLVGDNADAADDWIAERIGATDVCVTSDIPLASRCLKKGARVVSPTGKQWTEANISNALAGREIARHLRELGATTRGPSPLTKRDRSRFLSALDTAVQAALREVRVVKPVLERRRKDRMTQFSGPPERSRRAAQALARAVARRRDPLGFRDDRARRSFLGRDQHRNADPPRRQ